MLQREHSAILSTFIRLPFVIKIFVLSIFEWPFHTGYTVVLMFDIDQMFKTFVLGAQKSCLIETVLLCTHNICFG